MSIKNQISINPFCLYSPQNHAQNTVESRSIADPVSPTPTSPTTILSDLAISCVADGEFGENEDSKIP